MVAPEPVNLAAALAGLPPKDKQPNSARVLNAWIAQAERQLGSDGGRLGWLVASTITLSLFSRLLTRWASHCSCSRAAPCCSVERRSA